MKRIACMEMEGGGERKRKGGPLLLDWDKLLPTTDNNEEELESLVVVKEEPPIDPFLSRISTIEPKGKELRHKGLHFTNVLPDGGEKLGAKLIELDHKDDDKCKKVYLVAGKSTCGGFNNRLSPGAPTSDHAPQSTFAFRPCSKFDNERGCGDKKSFREELSTLHRFDSKIIRASEQGSAHERQKISLSSRELPFKSPRQLAVDIDYHPQSKFKQLGSYVHPHCPSEADCCFTQKENVDHVRPLQKWIRNNRKPIVLMDEEELEVDATDPTYQVFQSSNVNPINYPSGDDPESIEIRYSDLECLAPQSYLSSTILNFYIRYLQRSASPTSSRGCNYHFFNTYFYQKLKQLLGKIDKETSFPKFRRWWKGVNIFEKAYIFLPIHDDLHWSLVIICIPDNEDESGPVILHLDSLGLHSSRSIFSNVKSFLVEEWRFLRQGEGLPVSKIPNKIWNKLPGTLNEKVIEVPQQRNAYDCGLFVLFFIERFIDEAPERLKKKDLEMFGRQWFRPNQASSLREKIMKLLKEEFQKANAATLNLDT